MKRNSDRYKSNRVGKSTSREDKKRSLFEKDRDRKEDILLQGQRSQKKTLILPLDYKSVTSIVGPRCYPLHLSGFEVESYHFLVGSFNAKGLSKKKKY
jgi:hypothetical protein